MGSLLLLVLGSLGRSPDAVRIEAKLVRQSSPITCLVACGAMVLGKPHDEVWQSVRMWKEGTSFLEIENLARLQGRQAFTCGPTEEELIALLRSGTMPILAIGARFKHSVLLVGYEPLTDTFRFLNPAAGEEAVSRARLAQIRKPFAGQTLVVAPGDWKAPANVPLDRWKEQDRRYRAVEFLRLADAEPSHAWLQKQKWIELAIEEYPKDPELRCRLARAFLGQKKTEEARAELEEALRLQPDHAEARRLLEEAKP